ncbi:OTU domain-containing protein At3g57810-like, partial [Papaver somniferum]
VLMGHKTSCFGIVLLCQNMSLRFLMTKQEMVSKIKGNVGTSSWLQGGASSGVISGFRVCFSNFRPLNAEATSKENENGNCGLSSYSHGKIVYTDYSVIGICGDGRCLFRSVAHGACLQSGKPSPSETLERELADELRDRVVDEFIRRRGETEWFVEGDFDTYISQIKKPHVWGGEPELFMCSHVLQMPITVYLYDEEAGGLIAIAEYGQAYAKVNPVRVLYHGGHYDALQIPGNKGFTSRLEDLDHIV